MNATTTATRYATALAAKFADGPTTDWRATAGRKYDRVVYAAGSQTFVHAFVERETGLLYKAAGWTAPAAGARYDLTNHFEEAVEKADEYGTYLYR